jgi:hypothetical protein
MDVAAIAMAAKIDKSPTHTESAPEFITYDPQQEEVEAPPKGLR